MPLLNLQDQQIYNVKNGQVFLDVDMASQNEDFPFPQKKDIHLQSTNPGTGSSLNDIDFSKSFQNGVHSRRVIQPQVVNEIDQPQNQNSALISDINSDYLDRQQSNYYFLDSANEFYCQSENILSYQNLFNPQTKISLNAEKVEKNDSKNVPKGMMKAFAHMILSKNPETFKMLKRLFDEEGLDLSKYKQNMKKIRKSAKISIQNIRNLLINEQFAVTTRKLLNFFMRKMYRSHIFNSKMEKRNIHLKYIPRWLEILKDPSDFKSLK